MDTLDPRFVMRVRRLPIGKSAQTIGPWEPGAIVIWRRVDDFGIYHHFRGATYAEEVACADTAEDAILIAAQLRA